MRISSEIQQRKFSMTSRSFKMIFNPLVELSAKQTLIVILENQSHLPLAYSHSQRVIFLSMTRTITMSSFNKHPLHRNPLSLTTQTNLMASSNRLTIKKNLMTPSNRFTININLTPSKHLTIKTNLMTPSKHLTIKINLMTSRGRYLYLSVDQNHIKISNKERKKSSRKRKNTKCPVGLKLIHRRKDHEIQKNYPTM
uniref:Uncharacterized protein n=1 Tax=Cacopsylla melanoneura TaxID=428564 RepID=A0A8D8ZE23_9HEMI